MVTVRMIKKILVMRKLIAINMMRHKPSIFYNTSSESVGSVHEHTNAEKELNYAACLITFASGLAVFVICDP